MLPRTTSSFSSVQNSVQNTWILLQTDSDGCSLFSLFGATFSELQIRTRPSGRDSNIGAKLKTPQTFKMQC